MINKIRFGEALRNVRENLGYTQAQVEKSIREKGYVIGKSNLCHYENGHHLPSLDCLLKICTVYFPEKPLVGLAWILKQSVEVHK